ncbi:MAG TPA: class I SAM-dependent methyltransferase [Gaiellaceae bacterium]|nr:class I SAM-dependent methyltransferase [Gaiellaceae bacterium]
MDEELEAAKEGAWRELAAIDAAYARGKLDDEGWHAAAAELVVPAYLAAATPEGGSGSSRDTAGWEYARSLLADALRPGQTLLDVGCANGHLMDSLARWAGVEPFGVDISPELAQLARERLPRWADRIWVGNALLWTPPRRFDVVRTNLDYVPRPRRSELVAHLASFCDRLLVGVFNEEREDRRLEDEVASWGYAVAGRTERPHPHPRLAYRAFWIDAAAG